MIKNFAILLLCGSYALAQDRSHQILQMRPDTCGRTMQASELPRNVKAVFDTRGKVDMTFGDGPVVRLSTALIEQICPLADGGYVILGDPGFGSELYIVSPTKASAVDTFLAFDPRISPDERWIVFRKFFPRSTELPVSDEYLLYDLKNSATQNRQPGVPLDEMFGVGQTIYPPGWKNEDGDNIGASENQRHGNLSSFFWAPDSSLIVFGDALDKPEIVAIEVSSDGTTKARTHPFPNVVECDARGAEGRSVVPDGIRQVDFGPPEALDRVLLAGFTASACTSTKVVTLHLADFVAARNERRIVAKPSRKSLKVTPGAPPG